MTQNHHVPSILIIEDDEDLALLIQEYLSAQNLSVSIEHDGTHAVERIIEEQPDLVILDLMLPGKDGITICREARFEFNNPILMLTASNDSVDQILGLEIGADDYVQKPVEPRILLARIRALLRRAESQTPNSTQTQIADSQSPKADLLSFNSLTINRSARSVQLDSTPIDLTTPEFDMLIYLADHAGEIVSRDELFKQLRNLEYDGQSRFVDITMSYIRKKLGNVADQYLKTVRGKGYLFIVPS